MLNAEQRRCWQHDGYAVLPDFTSPHDVAGACRRAAELVDAFDTDAQTSASVFSTRDRALVADAALLASAHAVHCFFEEEAFSLDGQLQVPKAQAINKIGHALHELDPVFRAFSHGPPLAELAAELGLLQPLVWQSQLIFKQPRIGGEVGWHQDGSFFATTPQTVTTFWFALEDATLDNGCLWVQPGGQHTPLREAFVRSTAAPTRLHMHALDATPWPTLAQARPLPVRAGTLVVFGGQLPHYSAANRSPRSRLAYTLHATDASAAYSPLNWLQPDAARAPRGFV